MLHALNLYCAVLLILCQKNQKKKKKNLKENKFNPKKTEGGKYRVKINEIENRGKKFHITNKVKGQLSELVVQFTNFQLG